ncbi:TPA: hypothetical protein N0F65_010420 [Lagenidium giganteum]|uniref:Uncharacterized protein n=1 Tax=Lagenidium giganteum TaxID=4803 RepID=A0AAV2YQZ4_9STRA|nr:TPA: hypothetical protein N0F65_010420 [Lagenidium giganteum]
MVHDDAQHQLNSMISVKTFKYVTMALLLLITVVSALVPLWISARGTSASRRVLLGKLPFVTAGVFIGSGLLHLLPDAVHKYDEVVTAYEKAIGASMWLHHFPMTYLLCACGCMIVWGVDLLNMGDSGKMMAVATAARPNFTTSICRVQIPPVTSFGLRNRSLSADGWKFATERYSACSCAGYSSPNKTSAFHHATKSEESTCLLVQHGVKVIGETSTRSYSFDCMPTNTATDGILAIDEEQQPEATVSEHVVFSGNSRQQLGKRDHTMAAFSALLPYLLAALFSVHSLIAGFALGINPALDKTALATTFAIFSHKFIEAMSVGANFARAKNEIEQSRSIAVPVLYSIMTPLGIFLGMVLSSTLQGTQAQVVEAIALSIAAGSFVYLAFHEVSDNHTGQDTPSMLKITLFATGLSAMAALSAWC